MNRGRLEHWQEIDFFGQTRLAGYVYDLGHPDVRDGEPWITNVVVEYQTVMGQIMARTASGSIYHLGEMAKEDKDLKQMFDEMKEEAARREKMGKKTH